MTSGSCKACDRLSRPSRVFSLDLSRVRQQRKQYSNTLEGLRPSLSSERTERLLSIGFDLDPTGRRQDKRTEQERWDAMFQGLVEYHKRHGTFVLPEGYFHDGRSLFSWAHNQRRLYSNYVNGHAPTLLPERVKRLRAVGFIDERCSDLKGISHHGKRNSTSSESLSHKRQRGIRINQNDNKSETHVATSRETEAQRKERMAWETALALEVLVKYQQMTNST